MFTSNSYLAPDAGKRRKQDAFAELWKAESYMDERKITGDTKRITWFIRGLSDKKITWFAYTKIKDETWKKFQNKIH